MKLCWTRSAFPKRRADAIQVLSPAGNLGYLATYMSSSALP